MGNSLGNRITIQKKMSIICVKYSNIYYKQGGDISLES